MKTIITLTVLFFSLNFYAQDQDSSKSKTVVDFKSDISQYDIKQKYIHQLYGNVIVKTDMLDLQADKVIYNESTQEIVATDVASIQFSGAIKIDTNSTKKKFRYKIGETVAYLE